MAVRYRTSGIIIKKEDRREADQIFTIYTRDFGKLKILGKAIRKIKSKLRAGAELFYLSEIEFIQGKTYKTLTDAILIEKFKNLRKDLKRPAIAYKILEVLDKLVEREEPDKKNWQLLNEVFDTLNQKLEIKNQKLIYYYFLWNLLSILGYQPELYNCSLCQKKLIPEKIYFHSREGGVICPSCFEKIKEKSFTPLEITETWRQHKENKSLTGFTKLNYCQEINSDIVKILRIILKKDWSFFSRLKIEILHQKILADISEDFLSAISATR